MEMLIAKPQHLRQLAAKKNKLFLRERKEVMT